MMILSTSSADIYCFFSSSEGEETDQVKVAGATETLFSRKSFSSDSHRRHRLRRRQALRRQRRKNRVPRSNDPHADFRSSMVEMIMEKQIFGAQELEQLLYCFLSLNSPSHHHAILDVFQEICQALFTTWS
ncbi:hypothetical protein H6P81_016135 [Aristolochia fimbriata]|uniref:Transcription repressor n=1 Tax=Aristolochia fimbriata TaxID=158543 RepID=A0AAV7E7E0_ARIFI|nr:hypothetical protein H6P81_016135 [Aristolochia fimbriata]